MAEPYHWDFIGSEALDDVIDGDVGGAADEDFGAVVGCELQD